MADNMNVTVRDPLAPRRQMPPIVIGRAGEYGATTVTFDLRGFIDRYGAGVPTLLHKRPPDDEAYIVPLSAADTETHDRTEMPDAETLVWHVGQVATSYVGNGKIELQWHPDGAAKKSAQFDVVVLGTIGNPVSEIPDAQQIYLDVMQGIADDAEDAADRAEAAVSHYPRIQNGTWWVWDAAIGDWRDTGVSSDGDSAYEEAVELGFEGTEAEWLASLHGADGFSPVVSVEEISGGHRVTITDENHPQGQSFDVMDGEEDTRLDYIATFTEEIGHVPLFTNVIPISIDSGGAVFNVVGYQDGKRINSSGALVDATDAFVTGFIPLPENPQNMVLRFVDARLIASGTSTKSRIQFYDASFASLSGGQTGQGTLVVAETDSNGYITRINIADQVQAQYIPSANARYFRFSAYGSGANAVCTINEEIRYSEGGTTLSAALKPGVTIPQLSPLDARVTALENGSVDSSDPLVKYAAQLDRARTFGYAPMLSGRPTQPLVAWPTLNFLHISDTHGSVNAENAIKILNKLKADGRCAFLIHTGDFHASTFADVASWTAFAGYIEQANAPVLLVSGNHDVGNNNKSTTDGTTATDAQLYARCFEPYVSGWNLTSHPTGKCYWYKDFPDNAVRLIGLYDFESDYAGNGYGELLYKRGYAAYHQAQIDWLVQALLTCPEDYGVIIAKHNPVNLRGALDNPFNGEYLRGQNTAQTCVSSNMIPRIVQAFMDGETIDASFAQTGNVTDTLSVQQDFSGKNPGAHFICYLDGHTHADGVSFLQDFPRQLELNIGCDNFHYQHYADTLNESGTLHQDLMNYVSVDVSRGYVYIQRIGNDFTPQADRRDFTAIDYRHPPEAVDLDELDERVTALEDAGYQTASDVQTAIAGVRQLPTVSASDNGKFLRVVSGAWAAQAVPFQTPRVAMTASDTTPTLDPNKLYVFPEMATLTPTFATPTDSSIVNEYHFIFTSGATATTLTLPASVLQPDGFTVEENMHYEISILEGAMTAQGWAVTA